MSRTSWSRLQEICLGALERTADERAAFLDSACAGDAGLRSEVETLLRHHDPDFLEEPVVRVDALKPGGEPGTEGSHVRRIGPYRVVRPLGQGGMGAVYLAVQEGDGFERPVALKLIRAGMATEDVLERFRLERRILAGLDHPNLARLTDGGATEDGLPYFVMEYVEGVPITRYCEERSLSVPERLRLFMAVCRAVQHAHQSLVIHRDIKPGNVLVSHEGVPKLLDFGIGKVLDPTDAPSRTMTSRRMLTPEYAAPEQVRGAPVTTATDVHGLGVLLYELLTGAHPFADARSSAEELDRVVVETAPTPPSAAADAADPRLRRGLRGDLDNIVLMAMRKEPERRYASAEALREDVARHLEGLPVRARPDSVRYRASKFVTRNPWAVAASVALLVAVGTAAVVPWVQNRRLMAERDKALAVQSFLLEGYGTAGGDETIGARDLLDRQLARLDTAYADRPGIRAEMLLVVSDAYDRLGLLEDALPPAEEALEVLRQLHGPDHPDVARALNTAGWALHRVGRRPDAVPLLEEAIAIRRRLGRSARAELSRSLNDLGVVRSELRQSEAAEALHREALAIRMDELGASEVATGISASNLAATLYQLGRYDDARTEGERALELLTTSLGPDHQRTVVALNNLIVFQIQAGDLAGAADGYADLLGRQERLQGSTHPMTIRIRRSLGITLTRLGRLDEAAVHIRRSIGDSRALGEAGAEPEVTGLIALARLHEERGDTATALEHLDGALAMAQRALHGLPAHLSALMLSSEIRRRAGNVPGAARALSEYVALRAEGVEPGDPALAGDHLRLATLWLAADSPAEARRALDSARPALQELDSELRERFERLDSALAARLTGG